MSSEQQKIETPVAVVADSKPTVDLSTGPCAEVFATFTKCSADNADNVEVACAEMQTVLNNCKNEHGL